METQDQSQFLPSIIPIDTSPFSNSFSLNSSLDQAAAHGEHHLHRHQEEQELHDLLSIGGSNTHHVLDRKEHLTDFLSIGGSSDHPILEQKQQHQEKPKIILSLGGSSNYPPVTVDQTSGKRNQQNETGGSVKWMSSKMRLMRKMMSGDQIVIRKQRRNSKYLQEQVQANQEASNNHNSPSGIIRVCSNCNTTKTPLWRSGPQGPKSLCNACGIRQMKARRAMRAAAAAGFSSSSSSNVVSGTECKLQKEEVDHTVPFKKRFKITSSGSAQKKLRFDEVSIKKLAFRQAFPQEERDAAILLMGLSCGLIHS